MDLSPWVLDRAWDLGGLEITRGVEIPHGSRRGELRELLHGFVLARTGGLGWGGESAFISQKLMNGWEKPL